MKHLLEPRYQRNQKGLSLPLSLNPKARNEMFEGEGGRGLVGQLHVRMSFDYSPQSALPATLCMHNTQLEMRVSEELI